MLIMLSVQVVYRVGEIGDYSCTEKPFVNYKTSPSTIHLKLETGFEMIIPIDVIKVISY